MDDGWLAKDVARASAKVGGWRAQGLTQQAERLEIRAAALLKQAQEYRDLASQLIQIDRLEQ